MKCIRGTQTHKMEDAEQIKFLLGDDGDNERIWGRQQGDEIILQNNAVAFCRWPTPSWGLVIIGAKPGRDGRLQASVNEIIKKVRADDGPTYHPEAFDKYVESGLIDAEGNILPKKDE